MSCELHGWVRPGDCPHCEFSGSVSLLPDATQRARDAERDAIVAWLRKRDLGLTTAGDPWSCEAAMILRGFIDRIAANEHRSKP